MIIDFIIEDLMLNSYLQKNFHTLLGLLDSFCLLLFNKSYRHIDFVKIARIPLLTSRQHLVDGSKNHTGNSDNGSFLATTFNKRFIFLFVVRRFVRFYGCMSTLY